MYYSLPLTFCVFQTYNQAMKNAKAQYSEEKKAYDNRTPAEIDAANAAAAEAQAVSTHSPLIAAPKPIPAATSFAFPSDQ